MIGSGPDHVPVLWSAMPARNLIIGLRASLTTVSGIIQAVYIRNAGNPGHFRILPVTVGEVCC